MANDNETKQPEPEKPAEPEPVSDFESFISSLNSAYSLDPTLLTPAERTLQSRAAHSRELMQKKHARLHTIVTLAPGDIVSLKIPREDRSATDNLRTYCRVVEQKHPNRYRLPSKHDLLVTHYPVSQLLRVPDESMSSIVLQYGVPPLPTSAAELNKLVEITMHELAGKQSRGIAVAISCNCKARCTGQRRCLNNQVKFTVH